MTLFFTLLTAIGVSVCSILIASQSHYDNLSFPLVLILVINCSKRCFFVLQQVVENEYSGSSSLLFLMRYSRDFTNGIVFLELNYVTLMNRSQQFINTIQELQNLMFFIRYQFIIFH